MRDGAAITQDLIRSDPQRAVTLLMYEYGPTVQGLLRTLLPQSEDAAAEAFSHFAEDLWNYAKTYRGEAPIRAWLFAIARNAALSTTRDGWKKRARHLRTREAEALAEEVRTRTAVRHERQKSVLDELRATLDLDEKALLALRIDEKLSWDEVAVALSGPEGRVDAQAARKRFERLKAKLGEEARRRGLIE